MICLYPGFVDRFLEWGSQIGELKFSEISCTVEMVCFRAFTGGLACGRMTQSSLSSLFIPVRKRAIDIGPCLLCMGESKASKASFTWLANNHWCWTMHRQLTRVWAPSFYMFKYPYLKRKRDSEKKHGPAGMAQ